MHEHSNMPAPIRLHARLTAFRVWRRMQTQKPGNPLVLGR
jgi:hypothetical protein